MKLLAVLFLTIFAVGCVRSDSEECTEARAEACIDNLIQAVLDDSSEAEVCRELRSSVDCLSKAVDDCLDDEGKAEVAEGLGELEKLLEQNCKELDDSSDDDDNSMEKCFAANEDHIMECVYDSTADVLQQLQSGVDENNLMCAMYLTMAECIVDRVGDKCGETAASLAEKELSDMPSEIADACEAAKASESFIIKLLDDKRRK